MTPKEKAIELYNKFYSIPLYVKNVKQCCYITINEILGSMGADRGYSFWVEVKQEIEKL